MRIEENKKLKNKEIIKSKKSIGIYISEDDKIRKESNSFMIIYSKDGTHIVPINPKENKNDI